MPYAPFDPRKHLPDLTGKVILVTGGTAGLGKHCVLALAQRNPTHIYFTGRNAAAGNAVVAEARAAAGQGSVTVVEFLPCDLTDLASVRAATERIRAAQTRLDILLANAGIMNTPPGLTVDGYEVQFGTNHMGHALLIRRLLPLLERAAAADGPGEEEEEEVGTGTGDARVVITTSSGFAMADGLHIADGGARMATLNLSWLVSCSGWASAVRYGHSKLANMLYARALAKRFPSLSAVSVTPGIVATDLLMKQSLFFRFVSWVAVRLSQGGHLPGPAEAARTQLWCVAGARREELQAGAYYEPPGVVSKMSTRFSRDERLADELWEWTEKELERWM